MSTSLIRLLSLAAFGLACAFPCTAVHIDPDGRGQVLIYPYYTVNGGKTTLLTLVNTRDQAKAVRLRFRESRNGAEVMAFNLYLAPFDVWTGAATAPAAGTDYASAAPASISTADHSCTVPPLPESGGQAFYDFEYTIGTHLGPYSLGRTREGFVEVIELGRIEDTPEFAAATLIRQGASGSREACGQLLMAWQPPEGSWLRQEGLGVLSPNGGLQGNAILVDVALGSSASVPALALDGFFTPATECAPDCRGRAGEHLHIGPGEYAPTLGAARNGASDVAIAEFHHDAQRHEMHFSGPDAGLKAVSAVLMRRHLDNTFQQSAAPLLARTEWVVTFPTKALHLRQATPETRLPFRSIYRWDTQTLSWPIVQNANLGACEPLNVDYGDREGQRFQRIPGISFPIPQPRPPRPALCHASQVVSLNDAESRDFNGERLHDALRGDRASRLLGSAHPLRWRTCKGRIIVGTRSDPLRFNDCSSMSPASDFADGWMRLELGEPQRNYLYSSLRPDPAPSGGSNLLLGLPAVGFAITEFESTGAPGVLANFSTLAPHSGVRAPVAGVVDAGNPAEGWVPAGND